MIVEVKEETPNDSLFVVRLDDQHEHLISDDTHTEGINTMLLTHGFDVAPTGFNTLPISDEKLFATLHDLVPSTNGDPYTYRFRANVLDLDLW